MFKFFKAKKILKQATPEQSRIFGRAPRCEAPQPVSCTDELSELNPIGLSSETLGSAHPNNPKQCKCRSLLGRQNAEGIADDNRVYCEVVKTVQNDEKRCAFLERD